MYAQLSVLFPINVDQAVTRVEVFGLTVGESLDWIKQHADHIAQRSTGRTDYVALYITPDNRYPTRPVKGA